MFQVQKGSNSQQKKQKGLPNEVTISEILLMRQRIQMEKNSVLMSSIDHMFMIEGTWRTDQVHSYLDSFKNHIWSKGFWSMEQVCDGLVGYLIRHEYDNNVQKSVQFLIDQYLTRYSDQINSIIHDHISQYNQIILSIPLKQISGKRQCTYTKVNGYIPNIKDNVQEINKTMQTPMTMGIEMLDDNLDQKLLNVDILVMDTFGITKQSILQMLLYLPQLSDDSSYEQHFIKERLYPALNMTKGNLAQALDLLHDSDLAQSLLYRQQEITITNKGRGLICCSPDGWNRNEFVGFYYGELYTPRRWFEKQTIIKKRLQEANKKSTPRSPFQEIRVNEGLLYIDPTRYGNHLQNINEECNPNCEFRTCLWRGRICLGLFTIKPINYMEELTMISREDNIDECLCGMSHCNTNDEIYESISHIQRNVNLLRATEVSIQYAHLSGSQIEECPQWLISWAAITQPYTHHDNIITCIDKTIYVLKQTKNQDPPLKLLDEQQLIQAFWKDVDQPIGFNMEQSFMQEIYHIMLKYDHPESKRVIDMIMSGHQLIQNDSNPMGITRLLLLMISQVLSNIKDAKFHNQGLAIILYFMAFTHTYFRPTQYKGFIGDSFEQSEFEPLTQPKNKPKLSTSRSYTPQFVWGQLVEFNKQTLQNPQSSMAQERRGLICYPSFLLSFGNKHKYYPFQCKSSQEYLNYFIDRTQLQPDLSTWSYKNTYNVYGTLSFEQLYSIDKVGRDYMKRICNIGLEQFDSKLSYFLLAEQMFNSNANSLYTTYQSTLQQFMNKQYHHPPKQLMKQEKNESKKYESIKVIQGVEGDTVYETY